MLLSTTNSQKVRAAWVQSLDSELLLQLMRDEDERSHFLGKDDLNRNSYEVLFLCGAEKQE